MRNMTDTFHWRFLATAWFMQHLPTLFLHAKTNEIRRVMTSGCGNKMDGKRNTQETRGEHKGTQVCKIDFPLNFQWAKFSSLFLSFSLRRAITI
jgi:hypothetical protein